jgi:glycerol-3-phosphate dehydrogenase
MNRIQVIKAIEENPDFDFIIIGGGATGIGCYSKGLSDIAC